MGIGMCTTPYVLLLNNDTRSFPKMVEELIKTMESADDIFSVSCKMIQFHDHETESCLFEVMYSEPCPMIKAYCCEAGRYIPVFSQVENPNTEQLKRNNELLRMFMDHLSKQPEHKAAMLCQKDIAGKLYETIMSRPNRWEAKYYGMQLFSKGLYQIFLNT